MVYRYACNQEGCNSSPNYVGYTTCTVAERFKMHAQTGSIKKHLSEAHGMTRIPKADLIQSTTVLRVCHSKGRLRMMEAVLIKETKPSMNAQDEGCDRLLKIFKHWLLYSLCLICVEVEGQARFSIFSSWPFTPFVFLPFFLYLLIIELRPLSFNLCFPFFIVYSFILYCAEWPYGSGARLWQKIS